MNSEAIKKRIGIWTFVCGIFNVIFYLLHDIIGAMNYPGYDWMSQAVSDLTAIDAPSRDIAKMFTSVHGLFSIVTCVLLCVIVIDQRKILRIGVYLFATMHGISSIGYTFFPLTSSGYDGSFQSFMHTYVITALVVMLSIVSLIVIAVGSFKDHRKKLGIGAIIALACMFLGPVGLGTMPKAVFGIFERFSTYSAVIFTCVMGMYAHFEFVKQSTPQSTSR